MTGAQLVRNLSEIIGYLHLSSAKDSRWLADKTHKKVQKLLARRLEEISAILTHHRLILADRPPDSDRNDWTLCAHSSAISMLSSAINNRWKWPMRAPVCTILRLFNKNQGLIFPRLNTKLRTLRGHPSQGFKMSLDKRETESSSGFPSETPSWKIGILQLLSWSGSGSEMSYRHFL